MEQGAVTRRGQGPADEAGASGAGPPSSASPPVTRPSLLTSAKDSFTVAYGPDVLTGTQVSRGPGLWLKGFLTRDMQGPKWPCPCWARGARDGCRAVPRPHRGTKEHRGQRRPGRSGEGPAGSEGRLGRADARAASLPDFERPAAPGFHITRPAVQTSRYQRALHDVTSVQQRRP